MSQAPLRELPAVTRLVVRPPNWLGDAILALPALGAIRRAFPSSELTMVAPGSVAALFREETSVHPDRVVELPPGARAATSTLRAGQYELGILLTNSFRSAWQFRRAGIPQRWGYGTAGRGLLLTRRSARGRAASRHQADYYRALVTGLGIACDPDQPPQLQPLASSVSRAAALLTERGIRGDQRVVALAPGAAYGQAKQWPPARMAELAARIVRDLDATCVVVGAGHDRDAARAIESWLRERAPEAAGRVVDLVGRTTLGALAGVAARAAVFVANDSGGMHLAAAVGRPVVAVFGPTDERATRPLGDHAILTANVFCRPCMLRDCPIDHRCMKRVTVDAVFEAVARRVRADGSQ